MTDIIFKRPLWIFSNAPWFVIVVLSGLLGRFDFAEARCRFDKAASSNHFAFILSPIVQRCWRFLEELGPRQKNYVIPSVECPIYWESYHPGQWAADHGTVSSWIQRTISLGNIMFSVYFIRQGFVSIEIFPKREWFNSSFFTLKIVPNIIGSMSILRSKMRDQDYWRHTDKA
jgi:hypothetical protein